jgi:hypothetical protein
LGYQSSPVRSRGCASRAGAGISVHLRRQPLPRWRCQHHKVSLPEDSSRFPSADVVIGTKPVKQSAFSSANRCTVPRRIKSSWFLPRRRPVCPPKHRDYLGTASVVLHWDLWNTKIQCGFCSAWKTRKLSICKGCSKLGNNGDAAMTLDRHRRLYHQEILPSLCFLARKMHPIGNNTRVTRPKTVQKFQGRATVRKAC